jgi:hypothetical protein
MIKSLCETCAWMRAIVTPKGSRFLLCELSIANKAYARYPAQPVVRCQGFEKRAEGEEQTTK